MLPLSGATGAGVPEVSAASLTALAAVRDDKDATGAATRPLAYTL